jgi:hypothetical protein
MTEARWTKLELSFFLRWTNSFCEVGMEARKNELVSSGRSPGLIGKFLEDSG